MFIVIVLGFFNVPLYMWCLSMWNSMWYSAMQDSCKMKPAPLSRCVLASLGCSVIRALLETNVLITVLVVYQR